MTQQTAERSGLSRPTVTEDTDVWGQVGSASDLAKRNKSRTWDSYELPAPEDSDPWCDAAAAPHEEFEGEDPD